MNFRLYDIIITVVIISVLLVSFTGCTTIRYTHPARTAREQFLMSYAAIQSIKKLDVSSLRCKKVFVDESYFESYDQKFMIGEIRNHLGEYGASLMQSKDNADILAEIRSAGVGINNREILLGIPSIPLPLPLSTGIVVSFPEIVIFKYTRNEGYAAFAMTAFDKDTGSYYSSAGPVLGMTRQSEWNFFGIAFTTNKNLPSLKSAKKTR